MGRPQTIQEIAPGLWQIMRRFSPYIRQEWGLVVGALVALLAQVGLRLLEPWPLKFVFDRVIPTAPSGGASGLPWLDGLSPTVLLWGCAIALVSFTGLRALADYSSTVGFALVGNRVLTQVRNDLYRHLQSLSLSFHNQARSGDLTIRVISDVGLLKDVVVTAFLPLLGNVLILIGMVGLMLWLHLELTLLALATMPLFSLTTLRLSRRIKEVSRKQRRQEGAMASTAAEAMGAIQVVKTLSLETRFAKTFSGQSKKSLKDGVKAKRLAAQLERSVDLLIALATALVLGRGAHLVLHGNLTPGDLLVFLSYLKNAFKPVRDFAKYTGRLAKASAAGERILNLLDQTPEIVDLSTACPAPRFQGHVQFQGVQFAYKPDYPILQNISFEAKANQSLAIVGPSGSGKSTLASLLLRLYDPSGGRILMDGMDIRSYTLDSVRSQISVVLQDSLLFAASIWDNIAYGNPQASNDEILQAAQLANAHAFIQQLPQGYDTLVGERGVTLSGGQRQRIAIARAAVRQSPILILDEPTTGLDKDSEQAVIDALQQVAQQCTTLIITHDLTLAATADQLLYLENGEIWERGTHHQLLVNQGRYAALYQLQVARRQSQAEDTHRPKGEDYALFR
ncbi:ATP-binding cassette domain-containing protein [Synechococcales cyanobacterium C]|uniref:ATP-binding cassette domain-containing protein n=1 Tax=Petrachloros mirabilis ULC683 TaxID=2781853 RepID=A0A8K1ZW05_9CYAN|nr:ABC transporter ATP-binding protein [Petrachloros mirabilis]NCJ06255.1 ATP-binding cassette domain-containing protein [Petrachloros mirabilis ULC683]